MEIFQQKVGKIPRFFVLFCVNICSIKKKKVGSKMKVSETTQKVYDGVSNILNVHGQSLTKAQAYAIESMVETIEESVEKRCLEMAQRIIAKKDMLVEEARQESEEQGVVSQELVKKVNKLVESRIQKLKKELPQVLDYAKMKKLESCMTTIKECVGYNSDEQVEKVAKESAKMLKSTKALVETQAKQISEKSASLVESRKSITELQSQVKQMQAKIEAKEKQIVESTKKNSELVNQVQNLQKKVEESRKINETIEEKRKSESLRYYLEQKIASYPKYEASLLRKHFQNAKSKAEIDENFQKALTMVAEKRDAMRTVQAIPVAKVNEVPEKKTISGGETIVKENGGSKPMQVQQEDESFVEVDFDNDTISPMDMQRWMDRL